MGKWSIERRRKYDQRKSLDGAGLWAFVARESFERHKCNLGIARFLIYCFHQGLTELRTGFPEIYLEEVDDQDAELLTFCETGLRFQLPPGWFREQVKNGRIPCLKAEKKMFFDPITVKRLLIEWARQGGMPNA